jgi:DNA-directed RNA polymerase subunit alpha
MITNYTIQYPAIKTKLTSHSDTKHTLTIDPLLPGFGHTLGNSLRRVFISSIPGFGVTRIKINDLTHEYQPIKGVVEDAMDVVLNLKQLRCRILTDDDSVTLNLKKKTAGEVFASDFEKNSKVEIVNTDLYIAHLDKGGELDIEVEITRGHGYLPVEEVNLSQSKNPQDILVDALFSPVTNVAFEVEKVRVGDNTNFDKIIIDFETDGTVKGSDVVLYSLNLTQNLFSNIQSSFETSLDSGEYEASTNPSESDVVEVEGGSDDLDLGTRIKNTLAKNNITTNEELLARKDDLESLDGVGPTALKTIKEYIETLS